MLGEKLCEMKRLLSGTQKLGRNPRDMEIEKIRKCLNYVRYFFIRELGFAS